MSKKMTHIGILEGVDARTPDGYQRKIMLRETNKYWMDKYNTRYRKSDGRTSGNWPMYRLNIDSVVSL